MTKENKEFHDQSSYASYANAFVTIPMMPDSVIAYVGFPDFMLTRL